MTQVGIFTGLEKYFPKGSVENLRKTAQENPGLTTMKEISLASMNPNLNPAEIARQDALAAEQGLDQPLTPEAPPAEAASGGEQPAGEGTQGGATDTSPAEAEAPSQTQTLFDQIMKRHDQNAADTMQLLQRQNAFAQNAAAGQAGRMGGGVGSAFLAGTGQAQLNAQDKIKEAQLGYNQQRNDITTAQIDNILANERLDKQTQSAERAQVFNAITSLMGEGGDPELAGLLIQSMGGEFGGLNLGDLGGSMTASAEAAGALTEGGSDQGVGVKGPTVNGGKYWTTEPPPQFQKMQMDYQMLRNDIHKLAQDIEAAEAHKKSLPLTSPKRAELRRYINTLKTDLGKLQDQQHEMEQEARELGHDFNDYRGDWLL